MSRIGKEPIDIASGVTIKVSQGNLVTVKGPKGELTQQVDADMIISRNVYRPVSRFLSISDSCQVICYWICYYHLIVK